MHHLTVDQHTHITELRSSIFMSILMAAYAFFIGSQFIVSSNFAYTWIFYLGVCIPLLPICIKHAKAISLHFQHSLGWCVTILMGYTFLHALFVTNDSADTLETMRHTITTSFFIIATVVCLQASPHQIYRTFTALLILLCVTGLTSIVWHLIAPPNHGRLQALGQNDHAILGANVYCAVSLIAFYLLRQHNDTNVPRYRFIALLPYLSLIITLILVILTQSRGPLFSYAAVCFVGLIATRHMLLVLCGVGAALLLGYDFYSYLVESHNMLPLEPLYDKIIELCGRESHRMNIWEMALNRIAQHPLEGHGMQAKFNYGYGGVNPHNLFISAFYYAGLVSFMLLITITILALRAAWHMRKSSQGLLALLLIIHAICACITDQGQYVNSPSPLWTIFWLPIGFCIMLRNTKRGF